MSPRRQAKCRSCHKPIVFFRRAGDGKVVPFDEAPVTWSHPLAGVEVFPIWGLRAWKVPQLVEQLQGLHEITSTEAEQQARDMPYHQLHRCEERGRG